MPRSIVNRACRGAGVRSLLLAALICFPLNAQFFTRAPMWQHEILPVLEENCVKCHGGEQTMDGLDLTKFDSVLQGGISGPSITSGHPEMSLLWTRAAMNPW